MTATWADIAQELLDAATSAGVTVEREFIAPGPTFARDCRLIAVVFLRPSVAPLQREYAGTCAVVPQHTFQVVFGADCVPAQDDAGNPPSPAAVTAWSKDFLADADKIYGALLEAAVSGAITGNCQGVSIGQGEMRGPSSGYASMVIPLTIQFIDLEE